LVGYRFSLTWVLGSIVLAQNVVVNNEMVIQVAKLGRKPFDSLQITQRTKDLASPAAPDLSPNPLKYEAYKPRDVMNTLVS